MSSEFKKVTMKLSKDDVCIAINYWLFMKVFSNSSKVVGIKHTREGAIVTWEEVKDTK